MTLLRNSVRHITCLLGKCLRGSTNLFSGKMFTVSAHLQLATLLKCKAALILEKRNRLGNCKLCVTLWPWTRKITSILRPFCPMEMGHTTLEQFSIFFLTGIWLLFLPKFLSFERFTCLFLFCWRINPSPVCSPTIFWRTPYGHVDVQPRQWVPVWLSGHRIALS